MAKSTSKKDKKSAAVRAPSPAPSASSESPSSSSDASDNESSSSSSSRSSSASPAPEQPKINRVDPSTQRYTPPSGLKAVKVSAANDELDWDAINGDKDLELWAVRVPAGLRAKHLDGLTLTLPSDKAVTDPLQPVGHISTKKGGDYAAYLSSVGGPSSNKRRRDGEEAEESEAPGAGELKSLVPLLPRKSKDNKLFQAPRPISHTLTLQRSLPASVLSSAASLTSLNAGHSTLIISQPSPVPGAILSAEELLNPADGAKKKEAVLGKGGRTQPSELLKFRLDLPGMKGVGGKGTYDNKPSEAEMRGVLIASGREEAPEPETAPKPEEEAAEAEDVEMAEAGAEEASPKKEKKSKEKKEKKERRKSKGGDEGESPKKKKRVKAE
ncbi:hypothetical protein JCM8097_006001 [Rhodosporidiobolus ruineniae]